MSPRAKGKSRYKIPYLTEEFLRNNKDYIPYIAVTETWLKNYITDAQIAIENYHIVRADRIKRRRGGTLLYIHDNIATTGEESFDNDVCEVAICTVESQKTIVCSIYRPPDAEEEEFKAAINFIQGYIDKRTVAGHYYLHLMGDFTLPEITWNVNDNTPLLNIESSKCGQTLLAFMDKNFLSQYITSPTRVRNVLDLFLTNDPNLVLHTKVSDTHLSDHRK